MNTNTLLTLLIAAALIFYVLYRQIVKRPVSQRDLLLPLIAAIYLAVVYASGPDRGALGIVVACAAFGVASGFLTGSVMRVWRDSASGVIYQFGGWRVALVLAVLIALRIGLRFALPAAGVTTTASALNDAFIGMVVGNYAGRAMVVVLRALALANWQMVALPARRRSLMR